MTMHDSDQDSHSFQNMYSRDKHWLHSKNDDIKHAAFRVVFGWATIMTVTAMMSGLRSRGNSNHSGHSNSSHCSYCGHNGQ